MIIDGKIPNKEVKPILSEKFVGTISEIREHFSKKWCRNYKIDESKWRHIGPSAIDGLKIKNTKTGFVMSFWAGSSGTKNMAVDSTGGCHDLSFHESTIFEVLIGEV